jgi:outer membrane protein TolC
MWKNQWNHKILGGLLLFISSHISAQSPAYLSLDNAIAIGLQQNFQVIIDSNNVRAAAINNSPGNAGFLPQVNLDGSVIYNGANIKQKFSSGAEVEQSNTTGNTKSAGATLTWTLFDGGHMFATAKLLRLQEDQVRTISKDDLQNLMANIINSYYNVVQQKQLLRQVDSSIKYYDIQLTVTKNLQLNGKATRQQILQAQIDRNAEQAQYYAQLNALQDSKTDLNHLLQRSPDLDFETVDTIPIIAALAVDTTELFLKQHNPLLVEANRNIEIQTAMLQQNRSFFFPQLSFTGGYGFNTSSSSASFFLLNQDLGWNAGLTLSYNLFDGFKTRSLVNISKINVRNAQLQFRQTLSATQALLSNAYHKYKAALQQMLVLQQNLLLARENIQIALQQYRLYAITQIELQRAHQSYEDAFATYVAAAYAVKSAETNLYLLNGSLVQ